MDLTAVAFVAMATVGLVAMAAGLLDRQVAVDDDAETYLRSLEEPVDEADEFALLLEEPFISRVLRPLSSRALGGLSTILPTNYRDSIHRRLVRAGLSGTYRAEEFLTGQVLLGALGLLLALAYGFVATPTPGQQLLAVLLLPGLGAVAPVAWLNRKVQERRDAILKDLPDTLDLLAISVEAGVGFEAALSIVCEHFDSALASEFSRTLREMELGLPRREALQNLKRRTEVPELSNFILALQQADALGMPMGRVLKTQAGEMRNKRRQWAREKAGKLPVKILFPLILFIFPPVFVIVLGPAFSEIGGKL